MTLCSILIFWALCGVYYLSYLVYHAWRFHKLRTALVPITHKISLIIPARNEEQSISICLESIIQQNYPSDSLEIIVVNDDSEDKTIEKAEQSLQESPFSWKIVSLESGIMGKKAAISVGITQASYPVILLTDADTYRGQNWVKTMAHSLTDDIIWVSGPIKMTGNSIFQHMQALESAGLVALGAAMIARQKPGLANGANLMYRKKDFEQVKGFQGIDDIASGDDELLIHKFSTLGNGTFCKHTEAIVSTEALSDFSLFVQQRLRWVSKSRKYKNEAMTRTLTLAWLFHLGFLVLPFLILYFQSKIGLAVYTLFWGLKIFAELSVLVPATQFLRHTATLRWFFIEQLLYVVYVVWVGIRGNLGKKYQWKNRQVK